jgi:hypothetical protein
MMIRRLAMAVMMSAAAAGTGAAQQSITASATILERVEAGAVEVEVRSAGSQLSVRQLGITATPGTRLLRSTFVNAGVVDATEAETAVRSVDGSIMRLERRTMGPEGAAPAELRSDDRLLIDAADQLTITRVVASNS